MPSIFDDHRSIMQVSRKLVSDKEKCFVIQGRTNEYQKTLKLKREQFKEELIGFSNQVGIKNTLRDGGSTTRYR